MKAVIMAGGKGTRLRPLTCNTPKPMVPLLDKPVMQYAIELLQEHGITDIAVTLQYLPEVIKNYFGRGEKFGVNIEYFEETTPLGTAGSVKNAEKFLDETFLVISGDGLTDMDLSAAIAYHKAKGSVATLVLTRVDTPLEYGVVITDESGAINRFLEKPSWGEVFSDTVNTGIYILEPELFNYIPQDAEFDFSKDLFPFLLKSGKPIYGYVANGYWCDIGNLSSYRQTHFDILDGIVKVNFEGSEISPKVWVGKNVKLSPEVQVEAPIYIGANSVVEAHANIGAYSIIGARNKLRGGCSIKRSILWNQCFIDQGAELRGTTLCNHVTVKTNASLFEGAVIGDDTSIGKKAMIRPNVKLWPAKVVEENAIVHTSLVWGEKLTRNLFVGSGVKGIANVEITPDFASKLAAAYGATLKPDSQIVLSCDFHPFACLIKKAFSSGLLSAGIQPIDITNSISPITRFTVKNLRAAGGIHIRFIPPAADDRLLIEFFDQDGINIGKDQERKIETAFVQEDFRRAEMSELKTDLLVPQAKEVYANRLLESCRAITNKKYKLVLELEDHAFVQPISNLLEKLHCQLITFTPSASSIIDLGKLVQSYDADFGVKIDKNGENLIFITREGDVIKDETVMALQILTSCQVRKANTVAVPVTAPEIMEKIAMSYDAKVVRTKANPRDLLMVTKDDEFKLLFDGIYSLVQVLEFMAMSDLTLSQVAHLIPDFHLKQEKVSCSWADKGRVMRRLIEKTAEQSVELVDGVKVFHQDGWTLVIPDSDEPQFTVLSEASTEEVAQQMAASYVELIKALQLRS